MEIDKNEEKPLTIYQTVISGVEQILRKVEEVSWNKKLLLKNDSFLESEKYQKVLLDKVVFFTPGEEIEDTAENLIALFQIKEQEAAGHTKVETSADAQQIEKASENAKEEMKKTSKSVEDEIKKAVVSTEEDEIKTTESAEEDGKKKGAEGAEEDGEKKGAEGAEEEAKKILESAEEKTKKILESADAGCGQKHDCKDLQEANREEGTEGKRVKESEGTKEMQILYCRKSRIGSPVKIFLQIHKEPYRIPFELHLIPFPGHEVFPQKKSGTMIGTQENFTYQMFPPEEYLSLAFYEIIKDLELIKDMSWYKEVYEVLCKEPVDGRKVWENMNRLTREYPIPSFEKRLDTFSSYKDYGYMKRRWKSQSKRMMEPYPQWKEVIELLTAFFAPIFEGVLKDEVFLGDWMPELGRYLD